jgi:hypothetical protein
MYKFIVTLFDLLTRAAHAFLLIAVPVKCHTVAMSTPPSAQGSGRLRGSARWLHQEMSRHDASRSPRRHQTPAEQLDRDHANAYNQVAYPRITPPPVRLMPSGPLRRPSGPRAVEDDDMVTCTSCWSFTELGNSALCSYGLPHVRHRVCIPCLYAHPLINEDLAKAGCPGGPVYFPAWPHGLRCVRCWVDELEAMQLPEADNVKAQLQRLHLGLHGSSGTSGSSTNPAHNLTRMFEVTPGTSDHILNRLPALPAQHAPQHGQAAEPNNASQEINYLPAQPDPRRWQPTRPQQRHLFSLPTTARPWP